MTKKKRGSSSVYRTGTDSVKIRLIVLTVLAALLLLTALCAKYICPYDPYEQNLLLAKQHMQAYVNMGFALNEQNQTIRDIISILDQTIADFYPKDSLPGKRVKLTKAQIRSMIGRWRPSRENPMTIGELVEDIIKKVKEHQTGRYIYRYCRSDCTSGEDAEIYELVVGREESYFYDVRKFRFYTFMEETKK